MTVVNKFNVNKQQVTLDPDIIENMSANDVPYNDSLQYDENTVGKKLSDLEYKLSDLEYYVTGLMKSIGPKLKAFVVETNNSEGYRYVYIDGVKNTIPANSIRTFRFNNTFAAGADNDYYSNSGIASFHFLVTDTSEITSMSSMFSNCSSLTSLDLSNFDTSKVTNMGSMFGNCSSLTSLDLSNFDTSKVTNMRNMFGHCSSLTSLDLSNFDTSKVTDMFCMFDVCSSLTYLDVSNFDTSAVTNMQFMFESCSSLTYLDVSNFDTSAVTEMNYMFDGSSSLTSLILGPNFFKTSKETSIDFSSCSNWTNETVVTSLVTNSYNRVATGLNTLTLYLHTNTNAALTDEQKATITAKGYTIA